MDWERQRDLVLATGTLRLTSPMATAHADVFDTDVCLLDKEDCFDEVEALADVFPAITTLVFNGFATMTRLPDIVSRATGLRLLSLCWCANLTALPSRLPPTLASLDIFLCGALRRLHLPPLKSLKVYAPFAQVDVLPITQLDMLPSSADDSVPCAALDAVNDGSMELGAVDYCCTIPPSSWKWLQNARMLTELTLYMHNMTACPIVVPATCRVLELKSCYNVVDFNTLFPEHCGLEKLRLTNAAIVTSLPDSIGSLERLQHLELQGFNVLTQLPASCGRLAALTVLEIAWCPLTVLPTLPASLVRLELMAVSISVFPPLDTLRHLEVRQCGAVQELPAHMPLLHTLRLSANEALRQVHVSHYGELRVLSVTDSRRTEVLGLRDVVLQELTLSSIRNESVLPSVLPTLRHLTKLTLRSCRTLSCLPAIRAAALEALSIERWPRLTTIPACFGDLSALRTLSILKCPALTAWPASDGRLQCLTDLSFQRVGLHAWPDVLRNATRLQCLKMVHCDNLPDEALPIWIGSVPDLTADRAIVWRYRYSVAQSFLALLVTSRRRPDAKLPPELWYYVKNFTDLML